MKYFDIAKYLRENHLGSHAILVNYVDLHALKEESQLNEASLELDWASGMPALKAKCKKYGLTCKVVKEFGPGGGNPLVKIIGSKDNIISFLKDGYADADQLEDFVADIKENLEEEEDIKDIETSDLKKGDTVEYEGNEYKIGDFDTAGGANLVYLKTMDGKPAEDSKGRYKKVHKSRVKKLNKEADYGNNEPVDKVPYGDGEGRLDGFGDEFDQVDPVEEANGPFGMPDRNEDNPWMSDVDGTDAYKVGDWTCYYDYPGVLIWSYGDKSFDELAVYATPNYNGDDTTPIQIDVDGENEDMMAIDKGIFADFNEYARDMKPYLDMVERMLSNQESPVAKGMNDDDSENPFPSIMKEKKDSVIFDKGWQYDDDDVDAEDDMDPDTRFADLGGDQIKTAIKSLIDDGFDSREIAQFVVDTIRGFKAFKK